MPFGEEIAATGSRAGYGTDTVRQKFTSYERDIEIDLDFAQARYYNPKHGRFTTTDEPFADQFANNPQSWNLYSYVRNNPLNMTDPLGMAAGCPEGYPDCIEKDGKFYLLMKEGYVEISPGIEHVETTAKRDGGGPNLTLAEYRQQQEERRNNFFWNNIFAGVGHGIGKLFRGIGGLFRGKSPTPTTTTTTTTAQPNVAPISATPKIDMGKQGKHIVGHNNYVSGRSVLNANPQQLASRAGTGQQVGNVPVGQAGSKERVDFGQIIGNYVSPSGQSVPTTKGIIHYSNSGIHIVPAQP